MPGQIYNEQISDLLKPERSNLAIREDKKRGVFVEGLSEWVVRSPAEIYGLMERGAMQRRVTAHARPKTNALACGLAWSDLFIAMPQRSPPETLTVCLNARWAAPT